MDKNSRIVQKAITDAWNNFLTSLRRIYHSADLRPNGVHEVFELVHGSDADCIEYNINKVVFRLPERARDTQQSLFVVVEGKLSFDKGLLISDRKLVTKNFTTRVGYFRHKSGKLKHVYGAHFDLDERKAGHPLFHVQMASFPEFATVVLDKYRINTETEVENPMIDVIRTVRLPSAQMDAFSFFLQLCADHLIYDESAPQVVKEFDRLVQEFSFFKGAANRVERFSQEPALNCYRAPHWYPL